MIGVGKLHAKNDSRMGKRGQHLERVQLSLDSYFSFKFKYFELKFLTNIFLIQSGRQEPSLVCKISTQKSKFGGEQDVEKVVGALGRVQPSLDSLEFI